LLYLFIDQLVFLVDLDGHELLCLPMLRPPDLSVTTDPEQAPVLLDLVLVQVLAIRPGRAKLRALELQVALGVSLENFLRFRLPVLCLPLLLLQIRCELGAQELF
jgi:hypothetical protein